MNFQLILKRIWAGLLLLWESGERHLWRLVSWIFLFAGLWFFNIPAIFGGMGKGLIWVIFWSGLFYFIYRNVRHFRLPSLHDIDRRLEQDSYIRHRPLSENEDQPFNPQGDQAQALWRRHLRRQNEKLAMLRYSKQHDFGAHYDPYGLRLMALLFFLTGIVAAGPHWEERLSDGLFPFTFSFQPPEETAGYIAWITAPDYTGIGQMQMTEEDKELVQIPEGSTLKVAVPAGLFPPKLVIGGQNRPLKKTEDGQYTGELHVPEGDKIIIRRFLFPVAEWEYRLVPDTAPVAEIQDDVFVLPDGGMRFALQVYDDYGVRQLIMDMQLQQEVKSGNLGKPVTETRMVSSAPATETNLAPVYNLTKHPWAGKPVTIRFTLSDHLEQKAELPAIDMVLPERSFRHPFAKELIVWRKEIAAAPMEVDVYRDMGVALEKLLNRTDAYQADLMIFMGLRSAASRLFWSKPSDETALSVMGLLWDMAVQLEDGDIALASRRLQDARNSLADALKEGSFEEQNISAMMDSIRQAMAQYMTELQRELQKQIENGEAPTLLPAEMLKNMMNPENLASLIDQLEQALRDGDMQSAEKLFAELEKTMSQLTPSLVAPMPEDMQMMGEGINELQNLIDEQESLLSRTREKAGMSKAFEKFIKDFAENLSRQERDNMPAELSDMQHWRLADETADNLVVDMQAELAEQKEIRLRLGKLMIKAADTLSQIPENMQQAEQEMRLSEESLSGNRPGPSIPSQEKALEHLKESQDELGQQMAARMRQITGLALGGRFMMPSGMRLDPLGRPYDANSNGRNPANGDRVQVPDEAERKQAHEILNLLRRRAGERDRPELELDYYRRLLKRF